MAGYPTKGEDPSAPSPPVTMSAPGMASEFYQRQDLRGRVVLITGASAGIGEATSWRFAEQGCKLVLAARREDKLKALADAILAKFPGLQIHILQLDVSDIDKAKSLNETLPAEFKEVDILVNNAGLALGKLSIDETPLEDALTMMNINVNALIALTKAFVPGMKARGRGHIINLGSTAGHTAYAGGAVYCASKSAVTAFSIAVMNDLVATPIRVTCISPGNVETEFSMIRFKGDAEKAKAVYADYVPLNAGDIADQVIFSATAPAQVQIADIISWPTNQAAPTNIARVGPNFGAPA